MAKPGKEEEIFIDPIRQPPDWEPFIYACSPGYEVGGYDDYGNPLCVPINPYIEDPVYIPPTCPPGSSWDALRQVCVSNPDTRPLECAAGYVWDATQAACVPDVEDGPFYPVDCLPGYHSIAGADGQPICVADVPQTVGGGGTTPVTPGVKTGGILDNLGILDADGKLFGFEPIYVIGAAVAALFLFSGGGKR